MSRRFEVRREEMMADCRVRPHRLEGIVERLRAFAEPFLERLRRPEPRRHGRTMLEGLLSDLPRRTVEPIAYRADLERGALQNFMGVSRWDHEPLLSELARQVGEALGEADGVIVFDPSAHPKKGTHSVGVSRQWCGRLGKVENCQVGVYLGYASRKGHALADVRLFLPKEWAGDRKRRRAVGVPRLARFRTRHDLAIEMLRWRGPLLPHAWVAGDGEMGRSSRFRAELRALGERYLLAVPSNTTVRDLEAEVPKGRRVRPFEPVSAWREALPEAAWTRIEARDGEKGPISVECASRRVLARTEGSRVGPEELLLVTRAREEDGTFRHDYWLANAPPGTPLSELARVAKAEHRIEESFERAKGEAGLSEYEVRTWVGWHHHQALSLIAAWFLTLEAKRGEKRDAGADGLADGPGLGVGAAGAEGRRGADRAGDDAAIAPQRELALACLA